VQKYRENNNGAIIVKIIVEIKVKIIANNSKIM
jgi:hypothetical protein